MPRSPVEHLKRSLDDTGAVITGVRDDQWNLPTPCAEWAVRDLVDHLIAGNHMFARVLLGDSPSTAPDQDAAVPPSRPAEYRESAAALQAAFGAPGVMDRVVTLPVGTVPGAVALHLRLIESLVHGWDLAQATGQSPVYDEQLAEQELAFTRQMLPKIQSDHRPFGPAQAVDGDAPALDRLAACLGRDVGAVGPFRS